MESAIPEHLRKGRARTTHAPPGFKPPYPAWTGRFDPTMSGVVMAYFGVQARYRMGNEPLDAVTRFFAHPEGPRHWERARCVDAEGYDTMIAIAYWDSVSSFDSWREKSDFNTWWQDPARLSGQHGYFLEAVMPDIDRFETIQSAPNNPDGVASLQQHVSGEIEEHAYWGAMRDRLPISQVDRLDTPAQPSVEPVSETLGRRVMAPARDNLCLIRSGKDWSATKGQERDLFLNTIQPTQIEGMNFLRDEGESIGCLSCRYMTVLDAKGLPTEKAFGLAYFDNLANLEKWAKTHPTHASIFACFQNYVKDLNFQIDLRLYHEVAVVPAQGQHFEYINCHPGTGLLGRVNGI